MQWALFWFLLFHVDLAASSPWCPPSQRYDVHKFPPRCLDCPSIIPNPMKLSSIGTRQNQRVVKFSPGLPHNQTCGCWRGGNQSAIELSLNDSWIVSGLTFKADRNRWLKHFSVAASNDNNTFLDWGNYSQSNSSSSAVVLFRYPIRAAFFRLTVHAYVNHMVNETTGFPVQINALVSDSEPFGCGCASLSTGECCPMVNMEVKDDVCVVCMDPSDINTVMVDGCGRCKKGTIQLESSQRCVIVVPLQTAAETLLQVSSAVSNGDEWVVHIDADAGNSSLVLFLTNSSDLPCPPPSTTSACFANLMRPVLWDLNLTDSSGLQPVVRITRELDPQYLQFDRGRLALTMKEDAIRPWASCNPSQCTGNLVALFITPFEGIPRFLVKAIRQPLVFELTKPIAKSLVCGFSRGFAPITVEIHHLLDTDQFLLWASTGPLLNASVQWDNNTERVPVELGVFSSPPPVAWSSMRIFAGDKQYSSVSAPIIKKHSTLSIGAVKVWVKVNYGLELKTNPEPGDSEQLTTISAFSTQPIRLARLSSKAGGVTTVYTTSKGFIADPTHALDLVVACSGMMDTNAMVAWLGSALGLMDHQVGSFVDRSCARVRGGGVSKLYWLVPYRPIGTGRAARVDVEVSADFV